MDIKKAKNQTYKDLQALLRLSIAGIFIVGGLNYVFNGLIGNLEKETKNIQFKLDITKKIEATTLDAKYDFEKSLSSLETHAYQTYQASSLKKVDKSDEYVTILKYGGKIAIGFYHESKRYEPISDQTENEVALGDGIYTSVKQSYQKLNKFIKQREESILNSDMKIFLQTQEALLAEEQYINTLFEKRLTLLGKILDISVKKLAKIESTIQTKKDIYFYAQTFALFFIIFSLIYTSKPIRKQILLTNQELEEASKEASKMAIRAKQASKSKSEFLANMSHEIRTPLNAILGFIDLLKEKESDPEKLKYIATVQNSSNTLLGIINDILDFSKIESGNLSIDKVDFNVEDEFKTLVELFRAKASEKSVNLTLNMDDTMPAALHSDPLRIKQVIANLLSNALKFTPRNGKVELNIGYQNRQLVVSVKDSGIGVPKDKQKHIFKAFSQAESSTTRKYGGTGLGLSISSRLISMLGGKLQLESQEGKGSTFSFCIDVEVGKYKKLETTKSTDLLEIQDKKILLVEDNKANQMFMSLILKKFKLQYEIANDGLEAIKAFEENSYDLILMDENMPNLNGIEATKRILQIEDEKALKHTPIIALTANALKGDREKFLEAGMDEYLTKPINKEKLALTFKAFLAPKEIV
jgi:signal transduction histidine kinase/ActR/RegA family two-component response regulator